MMVNTEDSGTYISAGTSSYKIPSGVANPTDIADLLTAAQGPGAKLHYKRIDEPRETFVAHRDLPNPDLSFEENRRRLSAGYLTRNGDYGPYVLIAGALDMARIGLNTLPDVSIPRDPEQVGARLGYLNAVMQTVLRIYGCSKIPQTIGQKICLLGISANGTYYNEDDFKKERLELVPYAAIAGIGAESRQVVGRRTRRVSLTSSGHPAARFSRRLMAPHQTAGQGSGVGVPRKSAPS